MHSLLKLRRLYSVAGSFSPERYLRDLFGRRHFRAWGLPMETLTAALETNRPSGLAEAIRLTYAAYARFHGKTRYADKTPPLAADISNVAAMLPEARFLHLIRDGRDNALAVRDAVFGSDDLIQCGIEWRRAVETARRHGGRLGSGRYLELKYENLIEQPETCLRNICDFIDLEFEPTMLDYWRRGDEVLSGVRYPEAHRGVHRPPTKGLRDWRVQMSVDEQQILDLIEGRLLDDLGYERISDSPSVRTRARALMAWIKYAFGRIRRRTRSWPRRRIKRLRRILLLRRAR